MEAISAILGVIYFIVGLIIFIAILSIADNTKQTNKILRLMLNEQNPNRFKITTFGKIKDSKTGSKL